MAKKQMKGLGMSKQWIGDYIGRRFVIETDDYKEWGCSEEDAIRLAQCGLIPSVLHELGLRYGDKHQALQIKAQLLDIDYIPTRFGYLPSQRQKPVIPKPRRRKGKGKA